MPRHSIEQAGKPKSAENSDNSCNIRANPHSALAKRSNKSRPDHRLVGWLENHAFTAVSSLGRLARRPITTLMTVTVIAVALAMPTGLWLLLRNAADLSAGWQRAGQVNVFLESSNGRPEAESAAERIAALGPVSSVRIVTPDAALAEFKAASQFSEALGALTENPLPYVIVVELVPGLKSEQIGSLSAAVQGFPGVDFAQFDMDWLIRFNAILRTVERLVHVIAALLVTGVLLVVGNTIRLDIENRREEIEITKMLGGTSAFIRRPFLYGGFWYGVLGGASALLLVGAAHLALAEPLDGLASAYDSAFQFRGLGIRESMSVIGAAAVVGSVGAWLAVGRHLAAIKPG